MVNMKILDLPLKAKWYEMIESGNKKEEYREIKKYWIGRLAKCGGHNSYEKTGFYCKKAICFSCITRGNGFHPKEYTHVRFRFGYTPREIIEALGEFDLDPCAPMHPLWPTAKIMYNKQDNGLIQNWGGRIWLNPPYSKPLIWQFVEKLAEHGNGIALLFNRCDSNKFQDIIFTKATGMMFLRNRIKFFRPDGTRGDSPGCGSVLIAFGRENAEILRNCSLQGKYVELNNDK